MDSIAALPTYRSQGRDLHTTYPDSGTTLLRHIYIVRLKVAALFLPIVFAHLERPPLSVIPATMQSSCMHICHCGDTAAQQAAPAPASNARQGEWIWSTSDGFAANTCDLEYAFAADSDNFLGLSAYSTPTTSTLAGTRAKPDGAGSATTWLPQNETVDGLWGASAFVDMDLLPAGMAIDLDLSIPALRSLARTT